MSNLAEKMRDRLNKKAGREMAKTFTAEQDLLQIKDWIPMKEFFELSTGGKGFPCGHITQVIGETDSGKTTLVMEGMVSCQNLGGVVFLIDSEHKFSMQRFKLMGGNPEAIVVVQVDSLEEAWDAINSISKDLEELRESGDNSLAMLVWDSIAASVPDRILEEAEAGDSHVAVEAKINNKNIRKLRQSIKKSGVAAVFINHAYITMPAPGKPPKEVIKGGEELTFMTTLVLKTKKGKKIERTVLGETQKLGRVTKFEVFKGHFHGRTIAKDVFVVDVGILESKEQLDAYQKNLRGKI